MTGFILIYALVLCLLGMMKIIADNTTVHDLDWELEDERHI